MMTKKIGLTILAVVFLAGCAAQTPYLKIDPSLQRDVRTFSGYEYVPLLRVCDAYGLQYSYDTYTRTATIRKGESSAVLRAGSERALVDGYDQSLGRPVVFSDGTVYVPLSFVRQNLAHMISVRIQPPAQKVPPVPAEKKIAIRTVVLDAGHGGRDAGAVGRKIMLKEKELALSLSRKIKQVLEGAGMRVIMTRSNDTFIPLPKRADIANSSGADIFVSVHINASTSKFMSGFECYYLSNATDDNARALAAFEDSSLDIGDAADAQHSKQLDKTLWDMTLTENRKESAELAGYICGSVEKSLLIKNRGVRTARFYVLKNTNIPSVIVEAGYLSNRYDESKLNDPGFLDRMGESIARGILKYKQRYEETEGFTNG